MEFYNTTFFIRDDSPKLRFTFHGSEGGEPGWLQLRCGNTAFISMHLPYDRKARAAVLARLRSSLNQAIDEAEAVAAAAEPELAEVTG